MTFEIGILKSTNGQKKPKFNQTTNYQQEHKNALSLDTFPYLFIKSIASQKVQQLAEFAGEKPWNT
jgi:hypothetical protein